MRTFAVTDYPITDPKVEAAFAAFPHPAREGLLHLRHLILETASQTPEAGAIEETLKWGQPSYLTPETRSGTTIRLGVPKSGGFAIFTHCQSQVIPAFKTIAEQEFRFDGNRAVLFRQTSDIKPELLTKLIGHALLYHKSK